jgi:hypothetical protein
MKYDKQRKAEAHAKAVESATNYLLSFRGGEAFKKTVQMLRLPIRLAVKPTVTKTVVIFPPIEEWDRL